MEIVGLILLVGIGGLFLYANYKGKNSEGNKNKKKNVKEDMTVQDLFEYESITDKGIVKLSSGTYTATIELTDINQHLNNISENATIWKKFRTMMNSISIRETLLVQSQYLDVMDFVNDFKQRSDDTPNLTPQFIEARKDIIENYKEFAEEKTREYRSYIIFRFNPRKDGIQKGLETGNALLDNLLSSAKTKTQQMDDEEEKELAESVLDEVVDLAFQMLKGIGSQSVRLNRSGVLAMTYSTLNRDLSVVQRIQDASNAHSFAEMKQSLSPYYFEEQLELEQQKKQQTLEEMQEDYRFEVTADIAATEESREKVLLP